MESNKTPLSEVREEASHYHHRADKKWQTFPSSYKLVWKKEGDKM